MKERLIRLHSNVTFVVRGPDGKVKETHEHNLVLDDGLDIVASLLTNIDTGRLPVAGVANALAIMAIGDDNTAAATGDTDIIGAQIGVNVATVNTSPSIGLARAVSTFGAGVATGTWKEAIIADVNAAKASRNCAARVAPINIVKAAGDSITITWDITFS